MQISNFMSRRLIWAIVIIMSIALFGLISLQIFWLHQEFKLKEEQFNLHITKVFSAINKELEEKETLLEITNEAISLKYKIDDFPDYPVLNNNAINNEIQVRKLNYSFNDSSFVQTKTRIDILKGDSLLFSKSFTKYHPDKYVKPISNIDIKKEIANKLTDKTLFVEKIINRILNYNDDIKKRIDFYTLHSIIKKQLENHNIFYLLNLL